MSVVDPHGWFSVDRQGTANANPSSDQGAIIKAPFEDIWTAINNATQSLPLSKEDKTNLPSAIYQSLVAANNVGRSSHVTVPSTVMSLTQNQVDEPIRDACRETLDCHETGIEPSVIAQIGWAAKYHADGRKILPMEPSTHYPSPPPAHIPQLTTTAPFRIPIDMFGVSAMRPPPPSIDPRSHCAEAHHVEWLKAGGTKPCWTSNEGTWTVLPPGTKSDDAQIGLQDSETGRLVPLTSSNPGEWTIDPIQKERTKGTLIPVSHRQAAARGHFCGSGYQPFSYWSTNPYEREQNLEHLHYALQDYVYSCQGQTDGRTSDLYRQIEDLNTKNRSMQDTVQTLQARAKEDESIKESLTKLAAALTTWLPSQMAQTKLKSPSTCGSSTRRTARNHIPPVSITGTVA